MDKEDSIRIQHMIDACEELLSFMENKNRRDLESNRMLLLSVIKEIEMIGEAANKISSEIKSMFSDIPWYEITGMRNRLIHSYFDIDTEVVWVTVQEDIPQLLSLLRRIK